MAEDQQLRLADAIDELRKELATAVKRGKGQPVQFELGPVSMTFEVAITTTVEGKAGVQFWVVSVGGSAARAGAQTHSITVELNPVIDGKRKPLISERRKQEG